MRTSNPMESAIQQEIKRRTQKTRIFPNEASLERLVSAVLIEIDGQWADCKQPSIDWKTPKPNKAPGKSPGGRLRYRPGRAVASVHRPSRRLGAARLGNRPTRDECFRPALRRHQVL